MRIPTFPEALELIQYDEERYLLEVGGIDFFRATCPHSSCEIPLIYLYRLLIQSALDGNQLDGWKDIIERSLAQVNRTKEEKEEEEEEEEEYYYDEWGGHPDDFLSFITNQAPLAYALRDSRYREECEHFSRLLVFIGEIAPVDFLLPWHLTQLLRKGYWKAAHIWMMRINHSLHQGNTKSGAD